MNLALAGFWNGLTGDFSVNKSVIFSVASVLLLSSMQLYADAMGKGLGFDVAPQSTAQAKSGSGMAPLSDLKVRVPEAVPKNPQCLSGGQPCAEEAQREADEFRRQQKLRAGNGQQQ